MVPRSMSEVTSATRSRNFSSSWRATSIRSITWALRSVMEVCAVIDSSSSRSSRVNRPGAFVQNLQNTDDFLSRRDNGGAKQITRDEAGVRINGPVEARVRVRVVNDQAFAGLKYVAGDTGIVQKPDFAKTHALRHTGVKFAGLLVVEKESAPFGICLLNADLHDVAEQFLECLGGGHLGSNAEEQPCLLGFAARPRISPGVSAQGRHRRTTFHPHTPVFHETPAFHAIPIWPTEAASVRRASYSGALPPHRRASFSDSPSHPAEPGWLPEAG